MNIIVTGASRGIGKELVKKFSQSGHTIIAVSRREKELIELSESCKSTGNDGKIIPFPFDLSKLAENMEEFKTEIHRHFKHLNIIINNAGYLANSSFENSGIEIIHKSFSVNYVAALLITQSMLPLLKKSQLAHIVNIGSMGGVQGSLKFSGLSVYSSSKAALAVLTECLAEEYKDTGISFNYLAMGAVQTEMLAEAFPGYQAPVSADEMADFICDFALNGNKLFNGKIIPVSLSTP
ncbi:MAG: SDR family oxidoreductase [Bacteroidota bacterium]|nr:SDR family oxidoreductase [Bacteroidota bacterium]